MRFIWIQVLVAIAFAAVLVPVTLLADETSECEVCEVAERFARAVLDADDETVRALGTEAVATAIAGPQGQQVREALALQVGAFESFGEPWIDEETAQYRRVRLPATFTNATVDLLVAIDTEGKVGGFLMAPHKPLAGEAATAAEAVEGAGRTPAAGDAATEPAPPAGVRDVDLVVGDDADTGLPARLARPVGEGPFPGVVLIHGSGPNDMDGTIGPNHPLRDLAWGLAARGIAVLRYDKRSLARPQTLIAVGDALTVEHEVIADARDAVALLRRQPGVDRGRVFVVGHSLGASLAPRIAAGMAPPLAGVVSLAGLVREMPETMLDQVRYIAGIDGEVSAAEQAQIDQIDHAVQSLRVLLDDPDAVAPSVPILGVPFAYWRDFDDYDPPATAARLDIPVLVVQGGRDYQVTDEDFAGWRQGLAGKANACLMRYAALDHLLRPGEGPSKPADYAQAIPLDGELLDDLAAWILRDLCPSQMR